MICSSVVLKFVLIRVQATMKSTTAPRKDTRYVWIWQDNFGPRKVGNCWEARFELGGPGATDAAAATDSGFHPQVAANLKRWLRRTYYDNCAKNLHGLILIPDPGNKIHRWPQTLNGGCVTHRL